MKHQTFQQLEGLSIISGLILIALLGAILNADEISAIEAIVVVCFEILVFGLVVVVREGKRRGY